MIYMYIKKKYGFWMTFNWSKTPFLYGLLYAAIIVALCYFLDWNWLVIPWQPVGVIGIAVAFYLGFKNNSSYDRVWEARKIWGSIVNNSRAFASMVLTYIQQNETNHSNSETSLTEIKKRLIYRHIAWLTALRYQLRTARDWEHTEDRVKGLYNPNICEAYFDQLNSELDGLVSANEIKELESKTNLATQLLHQQSRDLEILYKNQNLDLFHQIELQNMLTAFFVDQGKSERIKNFPFPRQYASVAYWITLLFALFIPVALLDSFMNGTNNLMWLVVPFSALITWIFFLMEKIGDYSENPFEGTYNDVPITSISRGIEIDLREMFNDSFVPKPVQAQNGFMM